MWLYLAFLIIIGATIVDHNHAWEIGNEYQYHIESRTLTALDKLFRQFSGILIRGSLTLQVKSSDTLQAVVTKTQYASVNEVLPEVWDEITDLEFNELSLSGKPFEITLKNEVIRDMLVDQDVPTWEVNLLKSFVSQFQIDTQGENVIASGRSEVPDGNQTFGTFTVMEDSVGGKCEVRYSITPMHEENFLVPLPYLHKDDLHFGITKEKNYSRCQQRMAHHSRLVGKVIWEPEDNNELVSRSSTTHIIISGHLRRFTIQSSIMTNKISVDSKTDETYSGAVYSRVNITLVRKSQISNPIAVSNDLVSTGNLVYNYKNPLSNQRTPRPNVDQSSLAAKLAEKNSSNSSRDENRSNDDSRFSSNSTTEERDYLQTKPKLDEAPENPLLPYFIGYKGQSIQKFDENYTLIAAHLIDQISREIENVHETLSPSFTDTLERFTILIRLIRSMNVEQIAKVENKLPELTNDRSKFSSEEALKLYKQTVWDVFCYSVAHAGTGPALITIKNWIKIGKLKGVQAAQILSIIPKAALAPTSEYVATFFELITDEQVTNQKFLNTTAPLSFAELTRYTRNHNTSFYLVHTFDRVGSKHEDALLETYIPYMATQLREAVESGDSRRIQTYIMALGYFGHPKILSVFEPYLNGTISVSKFQRLLMVVSLNKLSEKIPRVVRNVAYKIYMNVTEDYELRCAAVYIIMKTNPPLDVLQRMAEFTNQDQDRQVNSAVKSNIENFAKLKQPEWKDLADKAVIASKLLKLDINEINSQGIFKKWNYDSLNLAQTIILQAIGGDDIGIPKVVHIGTHQSYGNFNLPPSRIRYIISNIRDWISMWYRILMPEKVDEKNIIVDEIEKFGIMPQDAEPLEGNILMDSALALEFYPFDNYTIEEIANMWNDYIMSLSQTPKHIFESRNMNHLYHYDITLGFPTETGLSFVYTLTIPKITMICGRGSYEIVKSEPGEFKKVTAVGYVASSEKIQSRIGFVTPFEHKHYIAGVDINTQFVIPADLSLKWNKTRRFELKVFPNENNTRYRDVVIHHSVVPYTEIHDILEPRPGYLGNKGRLVYTKEPQIFEFSPGNLFLSAKSDLIDDKPFRTQSEAFSNIYKVFYKGGGAHYRTFDSILHLTTELVNITFDSYIALKNESSEATIPAVIDKRPDNEARALQFLQEVGKDMNSPIGHIFDMSILHNNLNHVFTLAMADSYIDDKFQALLYWNIQSSDDGKVYSESCALGYTRSSRIPLNFDEAIEKIPNNEFKAELRFGSCADGDTIILKGNWTRTNDVMQVLSTKAEIVDECRQEIRQGNIWLRSCQRASELIQQKDLLTMSMDTNSDVYYAIGYNMLYSIKKMVPDKNMSVSNSTTINNNIIDMMIKLPPDNNDATISLRTAHADVSFSLTDIFDDISNVNLKEFLEQFFFSGVSKEPACIVDKTKVVTFDDKSYPLKLGKCRHVIMTTYPKRDPNNPQKILNNPRNMIVMAREMDDGSITVLIVFDVGSLVYDIYLQKLYNSGHLQASVNGGAVNLPYYESYLYWDLYWDREIVNIYQLDGMIVVDLIPYEIYAVYDGERIKLHASDKYRNSVRGLCGNYDMQSNNDFVTPSNCILTKPEEFAAMYALTQEDCEEPALQNKRRAEQSTCIPISNISADISHQ